VVKTKRVYEPRAAGDGLRVLVMRWWPRGIRKDRVDVWLKELGAGVDNLRAWKAGRLDWPEMARRYRAGLGQPPAAAQLTELRKLARRKTITLLCACPDEATCHRGILKSLLRTPLATTAPRRHALAGSTATVRSPRSRTSRSRRLT